MKYKGDFYTIEYNECDLEYIKDIINTLESKKSKILDFFNLKDYNNHLYCKLWDSKSNFQKYCEDSNGIYEDWLIGINDRNIKHPTIHCLSLKEIKKTKAHKNATEDTLIKLIIHEFIHTCQNQYLNSKGDDNLVYIGEGIAVFLAEQYYPSEFSKINPEDLIKNKINNYQIFYNIINYLINNYEKDYILKLLKDNKFAIKETPKIIEGATAYETK